jgi:threonylcarbamoyladenosine tRNA methylthiotransferase MtaB
MSLSVSFKTIGCRLNQAETAQMTARFTATGYRVVPFGEPCDAAVIHGCTITGKADRDSLRAIRQARRTAPHAVTVLAGCPAETRRGTVTGVRGPDLVIGQAGKFTLPEALHRFDPNRFPAPATPEPPQACPPVFATRRAFVKVQDGCDFRCAYCVVPAARGMPSSRPIPEVLGEISRLVDAGFKEVVLTGANLGCYRDGGQGLADLVWRVDALPGVIRIRLSSIELTTAEGPIVDLMASSAKLCRFLHIPLQSGDDGILAAMGRRYDTAAYRRAIDNAVARLPGLGLGTDLIAGFPGETPEAFENTARLARELPFNNLHVFPYSPRAGTRAATLSGQVSEDEKKERVRRLREIGTAQRVAFAATWEGRTVTVLVESVSPTGEGHGWTGPYVEAVVTGPALKRGDIVEALAGRAAGGKLFCQAMTQAMKGPLP